MKHDQAVSALTLLAPGIMSLLQDKGRLGQAHLGLTQGGPADSLAFDYANRLLANDKGTTALEISIGGTKLRCDHGCQIAITGAKAGVKINNMPAAQWSVLTLQKGDHIEIGYAEAGCRIYLAVKGGFVVKPQLGSTSTVLRERMGGYDGNALGANQCLFIKPTSLVPTVELPQAYIPTYPDELSLRVVIGYQYEYFPSLQRRRFFSGRYKVTKQADRMGYRLSGPTIEYPSRALYSEGVCAGAIQIPPDGQPIVLGADKQTMGGYPKIGSLLSLDLNQLMQASTGAVVTFTPITIEDAHALLALHRCREVPLIRGSSKNAQLPHKQEAT
ncbi:biotin-dependent carboxyltransferase [Alteromonas sediminis]|uniref:Biotin-dependent carboxyltransferase n=1 Tax=Alteromonas sediminis TaxID=2259342 RepID=A0A3N5ZBM7_9ALTE|nr:biotin-dependent carboxyltransferase family protein [Alteromonas sediminis]RPJ67058.1 biotin-dependent carboxyltransferase [Alteromonas sediminis]